MVKSNYQAWHIDKDSFSHQMSTEEKLKFFARYAILAPSGHNSQPWDLSVRQSSLFVSINSDRHLSADGSGLLSVEPYISIGTFIETYVVAARAFGYITSVKLFPNKSSIAQISITGKTRAQPNYANSIVERVSNRNKFRRKPIAKKTLSQITQETYKGISQKVITGRADIKFIASMTESAIKNIMAHPEYRSELSEWVRTNFTKKHEGMPGFTHGFGNMMSLASKAAVKYSTKHGPQAKHSKELVENSAALIIVSATDERRESFVNAGRAYSRICIEAQNRGIASSALGASVLDPVTKVDVCKRFNIKDRPIYVLRLGKSDIRARHSPRHQLKDVIN